MFVVYFGLSLLACVLMLLFPMYNLLVPKAEPAVSSEFRHGLEVGVGTTGPVAIPMTLAKGARWVNGAHFTEWHLVSFFQENTNNASQSMRPIPPRRNATRKMPATTSGPKLLGPTPSLVQTTGHVGCLRPTLPALRDYSPNMISPVFLFSTGESLCSRTRPTVLPAFPHPSPSTPPQKRPSGPNRSSYRLPVGLRGAAE